MKTNATKAKATKARQAKKGPIPSNTNKRLMANLDKQKPRQRRAS